jgi:hypothetical protein
MKGKMKSYGAGMKVVPGKDNGITRAVTGAGNLGKKYSFMNHLKMKR